ncbi:MAG: hypothetical protein AVDCRST_MAG18-5124, partial [uncultured Thermomicrobiales bacterium]
AGLLPGRDLLQRQAGRSRAVPRRHRRDREFLADRRDPPRPLAAPARQRSPAHRLPAPRRWHHRPFTWHYPDATRRATRAGDHCGAGAALPWCRVGDHGAPYPRAATRPV